MSALLLWAGALALGASGSQELPGGAAGRSLTAVPDRRVPLDFRHYYTQPQLAQALSDLAAAYPEQLRVESIGKSRAGTDLWLATLGQAGGVPLEQRPALLLCAGTSVQGRAAAELALYCVYSLLGERERDPSVARLLRESTLYVGPCMDPDQRSAELEASEIGQAAPPRAVELDLNFPAGWEDGLGSAAAGGFPLCEPESRAVVEFLMSRPNLAALLHLRSGSIGPAAPSAASAAALGDQAPALELARRSRGRGTLGCDLWSHAELPRASGSLLEQAWGEFGIFAFELVAAARGPLGASGVERTAIAHWPALEELEALGRSATQRLIELGLALPRLELRQGSVQRLKDDQWQVDVELANVGQFPSASARARALASVRALRLELSGAELIAAAHKPPGAGGFAVERAGGSQLALPEIGPNAVRELRLIVSAPSGSAMALSLSAPRAGKSALTLALE